MGFRRCRIWVLFLLVVVTNNIVTKSMKMIQGRNQVVLFTITSLLVGVGQVAKPKLENISMNKSDMYKNTYIIVNILSCSITFALGAVADNTLFAGAAVGLAEIPLAIEPGRDSFSCFIGFEV